MGDKVLWLADKVDQKVFSEADMVQGVVGNTTLVEGDNLRTCPLDLVLSVLSRAVLDRSHSHHHHHRHLLVRVHRMDIYPFSDCRLNTKMLDR